MLYGEKLAARALSAAWSLPLVRLDAGQLFGSLVGESEANLRGALRTAEAIAPAVLMLDELEKTREYCQADRSRQQQKGGPAMRAHVLAIRPDGSCEFVYADDLRPLLDMGEATIRRASHVEPTPDGHWQAELAPIGGPTLPSTDSRSGPL